MTQAAVRLKIMPTSPDANLEEIEAKARKALEKLGAQVVKVDIEPIAFGLNAIIILFGIDEMAPQDPIENALRKIPNVNSAEIIDFRRAFG